MKLALVCLLAGCGGAASTDLGAVDLSAATDQAATTCTSVALGDAPTVTATIGSGIPPVAAGGAIEDGTYVLTAYTLYGADSDLGLADENARGVLRITGASYATAVDIFGSTSSTAGLFTTTGAQLVLEDCAGKNPQAGSYTATPTTITQEPPATITTQAVLVFTRQ